MLEQSTRIYVGKIGKLTKQELYYIGLQFGTITDFLFKDTYAFIVNELFFKNKEYANHSNANYAIENINELMYNGTKLTAEFAKEPKTGDQTYFLKHPRIYIGRLLNVTRQQLMEMFKRYGEIVDINFKNQYAFIVPFPKIFFEKEYNNIQSATQAIEECNGLLYNQSKMVVQPARGADESKPQTDKVIIQNPPLNTLDPTHQPSFSQKEDSEQLLTSARLYVGKLNGAIKKQDLVKVFGIYGEIVDLLLRDEFAFIEYDKIESATQAMKNLNGVTINGQILSIQEQKAKGKQPKKKSYFTFLIYELQVRPENQPFDLQVKTESQEIQFNIIESTKIENENGVLLSQSTQNLQQIFQNQANMEQSNMQYSQLEQALNYYQQKYIKLVKRIVLIENKRGQTKSRSRSKSPKKSTGKNRKSQEKK